MDVSNGTARGTWGSRLGALLLRLVKEQTLIVVFLFAIIGMGIASPVFLTRRNLFNILQQYSMIGITACGMTFLILMADIDLSVGSVAAFAGVMAAILQVEHGWNSFSAIALTLALCFGVGIVVGLVVAKLGVHSFVATLGLLGVARGFALIISDGNPITGLQKGFSFVGQGMIGPMPFPALLMLVIMAISWFFLSQTKFGRGIYAIGGNKEATRLSGIPVDTYRVLMFGVCSFLAGLAGVILAGRVNSGQPVAAEALNLDVIASVIIGGTSLYGGRGGIGQTLLGTLILGILRNGLNLIGVTPYWQRVFIGLLIVVTVILDRVQHRSEE
jgi:ribose/xylose/arabinose/galactoside ABC-type transport system permease subunit